MKLLCILLLTLASFLLPACGQESKLAVYLNKRQGETVLAFNGIDNDQPAISNLLNRVLQIDSGIRASLFVQHDIEFHEFSDAVLFLKRIGFQYIEVIGFSRQEEGLAIQFDACDVEDLSEEIPLVDLTPTEALAPTPPIEPAREPAQNRHPQKNPDRSPARLPFRFPLHGNAAGCRIPQFLFTFPCSLFTRVSPPLLLDGPLP